MCVWSEQGRGLMMDRLNLLVLENGLVKVGVSVSITITIGARDST